jgi:hypothetical protein
MRDAAIARDRPEDRRQIVVFAFMPAARTEQLGMGGGSIKTPVQGRNPRRQQLDLGMRDGAELAAEIAHL